MNRTEFLEQLRESLTGEVSPARLDENLRYYDTYIRTQMKLGKSEEEVMAQLGDPRLIARTIIDVEGQEQPGASCGPYASYSSGNCQEEKPKAGAKSWNAESWQWKLGCLGAMLIVLFLIFVVVKSVIKLVLYFGVPLLIVAVILWGIWRLKER